MVDSVSDKQPGLSSPARHVAAITPSDSDNLANTAKAFFVGVAGDVKFTTLGGDTVTMAMPVGYHPISIVKVFSTGTTASGIYALYD